jgi:membrane protein YqaA with SNARE-associated domain
MAVEAEARHCDHCGAPLGRAEHVPWWHLHRRLYDWTLAWAYKPSAAIALFVMSFTASSCFPVPPDVLLMPLVLGNRRKWLRYAFICSLASVMGAMAGFCIGWLLWEQVGGFFHDHIPGFDRDEVVLVAGQPDPRTNAPLDGEAVKLHGLINRGSTRLEGLMDVQPAYPLLLEDADGRAVRLTAEQVASAEVHPFTRVGKLYEQYNFWIVFTAGFTPIPFKVITITAGVFGTGEAAGNPLVFFAVFLLASAVSRSVRFFLVAGLMRKFGPKITPFIDKYFNWLALLFTALLIGGFAVIKYVS